MISVTPVYIARDLVKTYKSGSVRANDGLSFDIHEGEIFGLLGPNGAGKSTLVRQLTGLLRPDSGTLLLYGHDIGHDVRFAAEVVASLTQTPIPLSDLTVGDVLRVTAHLRGVSRHDARGAADSLIERLGMGSVRNKRLGKLSGGQLRLASIATALVGDRPVLVLDEPTNELDPVNRRMIWNYLLELKRDEGRTIILVTHNVLEAERVIERVGIMYQGRIVACGTPDELKAGVDNRIRLDLKLAPDQDEHPGLMEALGEAHRVAERHWVLLVPRQRVEEAIKQVMAEIGLERLDDFRILTPSLEDVYLEIAGEAMEGTTA